MDFVKLGNCAIHYQVDGPAAAPVLLLLHSLGADASMWEPQMRGFAGRYRVIRYDVRGHGSSAPAGVAELTLPMLAGDALAVLDALRVPVAHWCGISMGGMSAMWAAVHHPQRVARLVLCNTSAHMPPPSLWQTRLDAIRRDGVAAMIPAILERWFTPQFRAAAPAQVERVRSMLLKVDPSSYAAACAAIRDMDQRAQLASIRAPTLIVCGDEDAATPLPHSEALRDAIPGARLELLHASHLSNVEAAAPFEAAVADFLDAR
jgi:3-oxoadipate enol-lactonase